ncbi:hypothetical protein ACLKA7_003298 [Drosophila subpalustris]
MEGVRRRGLWLDLLAPLGYHNHNTKKAASDKEFVAQVNSGQRGKRQQTVSHCAATHTNTYRCQTEAETKLRRLEDEKDEDKPMAS